MINTETNDSNDTDKNNPLNIFNARNQIFHPAAPQFPTPALPSTQNIHIAASVLDKTPGKTNVPCPLRDVFGFDDDVFAQGL